MCLVLVGWLWFVGGGVGGCVVLVGWLLFVEGVVVCKVVHFLESTADQRLEKIVVCIKLAFMQ